MKKFVILLLLRVGGVHAGIGFIAQRRYRHTGVVVKLNLMVAAAGNNI